MSTKLAEKALELLNTASELAKDQAPKLMSEFINYMTFVAVMDVLARIMWYFGVYLIWRIFTAYINQLKSESNDYAEKCSEAYKNFDKLNIKFKHGAEEERKKYEILSTEANNLYLRVCSDSCDLTSRIGLVKFFRSAICLVWSVVLFQMGVESFSKLAKIIISPNLYMIQEGAALLKDIKK